MRALLISVASVLLVLVCMIAPSKALSFGRPAVNSAAAVPDKIICPKLDAPVFKNNLGTADLCMG